MRLHSKVRGTLQLKEHRDILREIKNLTEINTTQLSQEIDVLHCAKSRSMLRRSFFGISHTASLYQSGLLSLLTLRHILLSFCDFYNISVIHAKVCYDKIAAL